MGDMSAPSVTDLAEISAILSKIASEVSSVARKTTDIGSRGRNDDDPDLSTKADQIYKARRRRDQALGDFADLVGEPVWDILLCLFSAHHNRSSISVSSACFAAGVPATTGLRCIARLEARNMVVRAEDPFDKRRHLLTLTETGRLAVAAAVRAMPSWA